MDHPPQAEPEPPTEPALTPQQPSGPEPAPQAESTPDPQQTPEPAPGPEQAFESEPPPPAAPAPNPWQASGPEAELPTEPSLYPHQTPGTEPVLDPWQAFGPRPEVKPKPKPPPRHREPLAVAVANASLFSAGYLMLGRRLLAVAAWTVTVTLVVLLATVARSVWFEGIVLAWWVAMVAHGFFLARKQNAKHSLVRSDPRRQWLTALAVTLPVLLAFTLLRLDAAGIAYDVTDAKRDGDCARAMSALDERWPGDWVANAPLTASGDVTVQACDHLDQADRELDIALDGDAIALQTGLRQLRTVLTDLPGHERMVERVLDGFLDRLPTPDPCDTTALTDELGDTRENGTVLDHIATTVPRVAPAAIVGCGDALMAAKQWKPALEHYQQLLDEYPDHALAPKAKDGAHQATLAIELDNVRTLLTPGTDGQPLYCTKPAPYSGAAPYTPGRPNPALMYGATDYTNRLPAEWKAADAANAVVVLCAGAPEFGAPTQTCGYDYGIGYTQYSEITFHNVAIPIRILEIKTARVVADVRIEIGGASCPDTVQYTGYGYTDLGPPADMYVTPSDADVNAAFAPLITP